MKRVAFKFSPLVSMVLLTACMPVEPPMVPTPSNLSGTSWRLGSDSTRSPSLAFKADGTVAGSTGCNGYGGSYVQAGAALTITLGPMTEMACAEQSRQLTETEFLKLLKRAQGWSVTGGNLTLTTDDPLRTGRFVSAANGA